MEGRNQGIDKSEAAGHLLAELYATQDDLHHGRITEAEAKSRVAVLRIRARMGTQSAFQSRIGQLSLKWDALLTVAERLKSRFQQQEQGELVH